MRCSTRGPVSQLRAIYTDGGRTLEIRQPLLMGTAEFGSIHIGVSTLAHPARPHTVADPGRSSPRSPSSLAPASSPCCLAQLSLRPIHVIRSGLTRLGQGEFGVVVDLPQRDEFGELGDFFNTVSARLSADRPPPSPALLGSGLDAGQEPARRRGRDFQRRTAKLLFANPAMRAIAAAGPPDPLARSVRDLLSAGPSVSKGRRRGDGEPPVARPDLGVSAEPRRPIASTRTACRRRANG